MTVRCKWCEDQGLNQRYHDEEWGIPVHEDRKHFEFLMMEVMQCGLSWTLMLKKREIFRECFENFDFEKIALYGEADVQRILETPGMIRSVRKIQAVITNARLFKEIREEFGTFDRFLWGYTDGKVLIYKSHQKEIVAKNELSEQVSKELQRRGFKYLGAVTVYSHLQASGIINDHEDECFLYKEICEKYPVSILP